VTSFYDLSDAEQAERLTLLARAALAQWDGPFAEPELFKYRENAVFSVQRHDGVRFALRIHRAGYHSDAALRSELYWMAELERLGINVPPVLAAADGRLLVHAEAEGVPERRQVDMLGWLTGSAIASSDAGSALNGTFYFKLGALAGDLHDKGAQIRLPADFDRHSWDEDGLLGPDPIWGRFWELPALSAEKRALLLEAKERAKGDLAAYGKSDARFGMIHADLIRDNVINDGGRLQAIDFDDAGFGWYLFELATMLCANLDRPDYPAIRDQIIAGYRSVRALPDGEIDHLPLFMFLRASTYLGWVQTRSETQTAKEMAPMHIARCCRLASDYLQSATQPTSQEVQP
jgi:Ser/Thr protein kinase RdoA (MazF antagonist)